MQAVKIGFRIVHDSEGTISQIPLAEEGDNPVCLLDLDYEPLWFASVENILDADGGEVLESVGLTKEFHGEWTVWFSLPEGLVLYNLSGVVRNSSSSEEYVAWLHVLIEYADSSIEEIGSLGPGGGAWDGQFILSGIWLENPIDTTPDTPAPEEPRWQRKVNTVEVNT